MTQLIITPIDPAAKGSYREQRKLTANAHAVSAAQERGDQAALMAGLDEFYVEITNG
jgi:hypothetical protein